MISAANALLRNTIKPREILLLPAAALHAEAGLTYRKKN